MKKGTAGTILHSFISHQILNMAVPGRGQRICSPITMNFSSSGCGGAVKDNDADQGRCATEAAIKLLFMHVHVIVAMTL
jgi:hypothetical protein